MRSWGDTPPPHPTAHLEALARWYYERWRARRAVHRADLDYLRDYTPEALGRMVRARDNLRRYEWNRP